MLLYLLPWRGSGTHLDPFRPQGVDQVAGVGWSCIDLRADPTQQNGWCIVGTDGLINTSGIGNGRQLGSLDSILGAVLRTAIRTQLGITLADDGNANTPRGLIVALLTSAGREDGTRWRNVARDMHGVREIWLHGELLFRDVT